MPIFEFNVNFYNALILFILDIWGKVLSDALNGIAAVTGIVLLVSIITYLFLKKRIGIIPAAFTTILLILILSYTIIFLYSRSPINPMDEALIDLTLIVSTVPVMGILMLSAINYVYKKYIRK